MEGITILPLIDVGSLEAKNQRKAELTWKIYKRLCEKNYLIPTAIAFGLDPEDRSNEDKGKLVAAALREGTRLEFLPRRMFENYLINSNALATILNELEGVSGITTEQVSAWLEQNGLSQKYFTGSSIPSIYHPEWFIRVHGARLITDLFFAMTINNPNQYNKRDHGYKLAKWILRNSPNEFEELKGYLTKLLGA